MQEDTTTPQLKTDPAFDTRAQPVLAAARKVLMDWAEAVSARDLEAVLALYSDDAILVPTMADDICGHDTERRAYFETFLAKPGLRCRIDTLRKRIGHTLGTVVAGGHYTFTFERDGEPRIVPARYLFTFEEAGGVWRITGHHSSQFV